MLYDLQGESTMSPIVGILYSAVKENNQRLQLITEGMPLSNHSMGNMAYC